MDVRMRIAVSSGEINVAAFCRDYGISRQTFYEWKRRYDEFGEAGLVERSRAPRSNSRRTSASMEDRVVRLRKELVDAGLDAGASTIQWHLGRQGGGDRVPSEATIWRILVRRGFVVPDPRKAPKVALRRFEASAPNELWQTDCTDWMIATGPVKILSFLDDRSRVALRVKALENATTEATWLTFSEATAAWGVPLGQLSDNGLNFSGRLRGFEVYFETQLRAIGVSPKTSRPFHPQTCGKVERFQQTLKKWLRRQPLANSIDELQAQLDTFSAYYNHERPHRGIGRVTPIERWTATPPAINPGVAIPASGPNRQHQSITTVQANGTIVLTRYTIGIGTKWAGHTATVHHDQTHAAVYIDSQLVRALTLDPTKRYQPSKPTQPT